MNPLDQLAGWPVPNACAAVLDSSGVLTSWGELDRAYYLASVTKPLTAFATLVAVEEGALELETSLSGQLSSVLPGATLRHLLAHASGIAPEGRLRAADPGTRRIYSNAGYDVIGEMVSESTEMPFAQYLHEAVLAPLRMNSASLQSSARATGSPAKDAWACLADLCAFLAELLRPSGLLAASTLAEATTVQFPGLSGVVPGYGNQHHNDWGLGFEIKSDKRPHWTAEQNSPATYGHFGRSGTMFWIDPEAGLGLVTLADRDFGSWAIESWPRLGTAVLDAYG